MTIEVVVVFPDTIISTFTITRGPTISTTIINNSIAVNATIVSSLCHSLQTLQPYYTYITFLSHKIRFSTKQFMVMPRCHSNTVLGCCNVLYIMRN